MSLGPRGADRLPKKLELNEAEAQSGNPPATQFMNMVESDQVNFYFREAISKYELEQARMNAGRSSIHYPEPEFFMPDIDMDSVGSRLSNRTTMIVTAETKVIRDYRTWQRQGQRMVVGSITKEFGFLPCPN